MGAKKTRRLQVLIEESQWARLKAQAAARGVSVTALVREAIDTALLGGGRPRAPAARAILDAAPMPLPDRVDLWREPDKVRGRRA